MLGYGSSFTTIADLPFPNSSISATALNFIEPLPFNIASFIVGVSTIKPPVGKSGPLLSSIIVSWFWIFCF